MNDCPTGCGRKARAGHLMCSPCWREVPPNLQRDVYRTWRAVQRSSWGDDEMEAYQAAREAAIGSIR